jgi:hypothetical protein
MFHLPCQAKPRVLYVVSAERDVVSCIDQAIASIEYVVSCMDQASNDTARLVFHVWLAAVSKICFEFPWYLVTLFVPVLAV